MMLSIIESISSSGSSLSSLTTATTPSSMMTMPSSVTTASSSYSIISNPQQPTSHSALSSFHLPMHQHQNHNEIHRQFRVLDEDDEDFEGEGDDIDYSDVYSINPYLICSWNWKDADSIVTQTCVWRFPNMTVSTTPTSPTTAEKSSDPSSPEARTKRSDPSNRPSSSATGVSYIRTMSDYEVQSICTWETSRSNKFTCEVSGTDETGERYITYTAECDSKDLAKSNQNACKPLQASIPTRDPTCQQCEWNLRQLRQSSQPTAKQRGRRQLQPQQQHQQQEGRHYHLRRLEDGGGLLKDSVVDGNGTAECHEECWTATELCKTVVFAEPESKKSLPDYHGIPWADSLRQTMQWAVDMGQSNTPMAFYDVQFLQPSLQEQDFAFGMTLDCPSGTYTGSDLTLVEDYQEGMRSGGWGILKGTIILLVASLALLFYLYRAGHCQKRPKTNRVGEAGSTDGGSRSGALDSKGIRAKGSVGSSDALMLEGSSSTDSPVKSPTSPPRSRVRGSSSMLPPPLSASSSPPIIINLPADSLQHLDELPNFPPPPRRERASSTPVLHSMTGEKMVVRDGIWAPQSQQPSTPTSRRAVLRTANSWQEEAEAAEDNREGQNVHLPVMIVLDEDSSGEIQPPPYSMDDEEISVAGSTDYDDILQEVI